MVAEQIRSSCGAISRGVSVRLTLVPRTIDVVWLLHKKLSVVTSPSGSDDVMVHVATSVLYRGLGEMETCVMMGSRLMILADAELISVPPLGSEMVASHCKVWFGLIKESFNSKV